MFVKVIQTRGRLRRRLLAVLACWLLCCHAPALADEEIRIASNNWCPYVCGQNGQISDGYLIELVTQALTRQSIKVHPLMLPYTRALRSAELGTLEGVYAPAADRRLRRSTPVGYSRACFYTRLDSRWRYRGIASLTSVVLGVGEDYGYDDDVLDDYIARSHDRPGRLEFAHGHEASDINLHKLLHKRFDVMVEHEAVAARLIGELGDPKHVRKAGCLARSFPLTVAFRADDPRAERWIRALGQGMLKLKAAGGVAALQRRYRVQDTPAAHPVLSH